MDQPWHFARPELRAEVEKTLRSSYPDLHLTIVEGTAVVHGSFPVRDPDGRTLTNFAVEIIFPPTYPDGLPVVRETFSRIPHTPTRHVNPDGTCCLGAIGEWLLTASDKSFRGFMEGPVANYFLGQALVEQGQPWPFGERSHGLKGLFESYAEILGISDYKRVPAYLEYLSRTEIKGHWSCPCGSGQILRRCHVTRVRELQKRIPPRTAKQLLSNLREHGA